MSQTMRRLFRVLKSTPKVAIPAINAQDSTSNLVGENQTNIAQGIELIITILPRLNSSFA